jgi:hypothetical protein
VKTKHIKKKEDEEKEDKEYDVGSLMKRRRRGESRSRRKERRSRRKEDVEEGKVESEDKDIDGSTVSAGHIVAGVIITTQPSVTI